MSLEDLLEEMGVPRASEVDGPPAAARAGSAGDEPSRRDRMRGMLLGHALGDALGAPHEFRNQVPLERYSGRVEHPLFVTRRWQGGRKTGNLGQVTDDTEMAIALARTLVGGAPGYRAGNAVDAYLAWANSKCPFMGHNTRRLFVGVRTAKGFEGRRREARSGPPAAWSQGNGCLMRAAPLAALAGWMPAALSDCALTNPHPVCVCAVTAYVAAAHELLAGAGPAAATAAALLIAESWSDPAVSAIVSVVLRAARALEPRLVADELKGWVLHGLYCAFYALNLPLVSYQGRIDIIVRLGGDTDTNAAIAGALLGACLGETQMRAEERTGPNLNLMLAVVPTAGDLPRPVIYGAAQLPALADELALLDV